MIAIREANRYDIPQLIEMLDQYAAVITHTFARKGTNHADTQKIFEEIIAGRGKIFVSTYNDSIVGLIAGYVVNNIWNHNVLMMHEIMFWVDPDYRGTRAGYLLLKEYAALVKEWIAQKRIDAALITNMDKSKVDYSRFGFKRYQEEWIL